MRQVKTAMDPAAQPHDLSVRPLRAFALRVLAYGRRLWSQPDVRWVVFLFLLALVLRTVWAIYTDRPPRGFNDPVLYDFFAAQIKEGNGYSRLDGTPTAYYPVGYPAALSAVYFVFGHSILAAKLFNAVLGAVTVVLLFELARRLFDSRAARAAGLLLAVFPGQIFYTGTILGEVLFTMLLVGALLLLLAAPWDAGRVGLGRLALFGLIMGAATLVRSITLLLPLLLLVFWLFTSRRVGRSLLQAGVVTLAMAVFVVPWSVRSSIRMETPVLISLNAGDNLCMGNHEGAPGHFTLTDKCFADDQPGDSRTLEVERNRENIEKGVTFISENPLEAARIVLRKAYYLFYRDSGGLFATESYGNDPFIPTFRREVLADVADGFYFVAGAYAALGVGLWLFRPEPRRTLLLLSTAYVAAVPLIFFGDPRFHFPVIPLACVLAGSAMAAVWQRARAGAPGLVWVTQA